MHVQQDVCLFCVIACMDRGHYIPVHTWTINKPHLPCMHDCHGHIRISSSNSGCMLLISTSNDHHSRMESCNQLPIIKKLWFRYVWHPWHLRWKLALYMCNDISNVCHIWHAEIVLSIAGFYSYNYNSTKLALSKGSGNETKVNMLWPIKVGHG